MVELWEHQNSERLAAIIIDIYMYVYMTMAIITVEILSNMETKLVLVLHLDHKPLNIKTTQWNRLRNVNAKVLFIQKNRSSIVYLRLFTGFPLPILRRRSHVAATGWRGQCLCNCQLNFLILICGHIRKCFSHHYCVNIWKNIEKKVNTWFIFWKYIKEPLKAT